MLQRRHFLRAFTACAASAIWPAALVRAAGIAFDLSPRQAGRPRAPADPAAISALHGLHLLEPGVLTVAVVPAFPPVSTYATDARTVIGADPDYAQLLADSLGLRLALIPVAWVDWPLGLSSGKYDAVISNVGVTERRKQKFDFTTYRQGLHGFFVPLASPIQKISEPRDVAGLRVITSSGTIQERILIEWNRRNAAQGLAAATLLYYGDVASAELALLSGRADAIFNPHAGLAYLAATQGRIRQVGLINAGWPLRADVAVATRKGSGLAPVLTLATNDLIRSGLYRTALARWGLESEALERAETNPPGYADA